MADAKTRPARESMSCPYCGWSEDSSSDETYFLLEYPEWPGCFDNDERLLDKYTSCECPKCKYTGPLSHF